MRPSVICGSAMPAAAWDRSGVAPLAVMYVGAGIYEEVLFRLCLLPVCYGLFRTGGLGHGWSAGLAVVATSLAFSLAHYVGPAGEIVSALHVLVPHDGRTVFRAALRAAWFRHRGRRHAAYDSALWGSC